MKTISLVSKICIVFAICLAASYSYGHYPRHMSPPYHSSHMHHRHHYSTWGRGGCHFWPGFMGGLIGSTIYRPLPPPPPPPVVIAPSPVIMPSPVVVRPAPVVVPVRPVIGF